MTDSNELIGAVRGVIVGAAGQAITIREGVGEVAERITAASDALTWRVEATSTFTGILDLLVEDLRGLQGRLVVLHDELIRWDTAVTIGEERGIDRVGRIADLMGGTATPPDVPGAR